MCDCSSWIIQWILPLHNITTCREVILLRYNANIIDLFKWFGIHMYIVYTRWFYVWLFEFNHLKDITPVYHHNLARSLHGYVTTRTSLTFSIYLWAMYIVYNRWLYVWLFKFNPFIHYCDHVVAKLNACVISKYGI
jgi:hypothetical protein